MGVSESTKKEVHAMYYYGKIDSKNESFYDCILVKNNWDHSALSQLIFLASSEPIFKI